MTTDLTPQDKAKKAAATRAAAFVETGMKVGLGTGSTAKFFVELTPERLLSGGSQTFSQASAATFLRYSRDMPTTLGLRVRSGAA